MNKVASGFTLIELMMVVGILAIIAAVAIPAYNNQVDKTRRADAKAGLMNVAQQLERCFTRSNAYTAAGCPTGSTISPDEFYTITVAATATTYSLTAEPRGNQVSDAAKCTNFTLDHLGNRNATGTQADKCWN